MPLFPSVHPHSHFLLKEPCRRAPADNAACECAYYVRLPAAFAAELDAESVSYEGSTARVITKPMSVKAMHELAKRLRKGGAELFFAELG